MALGHSRGQAAELCVLPVLLESSAQPTANLSCSFQNEEILACVYMFWALTSFQSGQSCVMLHTGSINLWWPKNSLQWEEHHKMSTMFLPGKFSPPPAHQYSTRLGTAASGWSHHCTTSALTPHKKEAHLCKQPASSQLWAQHILRPFCRNTRVPLWAPLEPSETSKTLLCKLNRSAIS